MCDGDLGGHGENHSLTLVHLKRGHLAHIVHALQFSLCAAAKYTNNTYIYLTFDPIAVEQSSKNACGNFFALSNQQRRTKTPNR